MGPLLRLGTSLSAFVLICAVAKKCDRKFDLHLEKIILSESSEQNGAVFLKKITAQSPESCYTTCCEIDRCTVAVYTPKRGKECYLFNCGDPNICNFTSHADYTVFMLQQPKQHPARTSDPPTTALVTAADSRQKGTLHGRCGPAVPCTDENTICDSGLCVCQAGWIEKMHTCVRSVCKKPDLQFQCNDGSACIAIYDVCNGIAECRDESDEVGCDESDVLRKYTSAAADLTPTAHKAADNSSHPASPPKLDNPRNRLMHGLYRQRKQEQSQPAEKTRTAVSAAASTAASDARPGDFLYDLDASSIENELHSLRTGRRRHGTARSGSINNLAEHSTYEELMPRSRRPTSVWRLDDPPVEEEAGDSGLSPFLMRLVDGDSKNRQHRLENLLDAYGPVPSLLQHQRFPSLAAIPKEGEEEEESAVEPPGRRRRFLRPPPPAVLTAPPKSRGFRLHPLLERYARARFFPPSEEEEPVEEGEALVEPSATGTMAVLPRSHLPRQPTALPYRGRPRRRGHGVAFYEENEPTPKNGVRETEMSGGVTAGDDTARAVESKSIADGGGGGGVSFTSSFAARNRTQWHIAAILLAVGLGLISCLFGFLVGRCRKDTCGGARSKAVAASRLRRRIRDSRQAAAAAAGLGSDLEKNGLLTGLQL